MAANSQFIALSDGRKLAYDLRGPGDAPIILLSNSLLTNYCLWDQFAEELSRMGFRTLLYDQAGHGFSSPPDNPGLTTFLTLSDDVAELLKRLDIKEIYTWIGISMGAATGIYFVTRYPNTVQRLVLADTITSSPINAGVPDAFKPRADIAKNEADAIGKLSEATLERWFSLSWRDTNTAEVQRMRSLMRTTSRTGFIACCNALSHDTFDLRPMLKKVGSSVEAVLLLVGERDANLPETMREMGTEMATGFANADQVSLKVIKDAGHVPVIDGYLQFRNEVSSFLVGKGPNKI